MPNKCLFLLQDGVGDRPIPGLGGKTPLEAAATPNMDGLVRKGIAGLVDIVSPGVVVGTDVGHLALFGQPAGEGNYGRGPIEAAGLGVLLGPADIALRFNFATVDEDFTVLDRRAGRIRENTDVLSKSLEDIPLEEGIEAIFLAATEHRGVLILRGPGLSAEVTDSDPGSDNQKVREILPRRDHSGARRTANLVNNIVRKAHAILRDHPVNVHRLKEGRLPANIILTRGAGRQRSYLNLPEKEGLRIACVSGECTVLGIARLAGVTPFFEAGMTANLDTDLQAKAQAAIAALKNFNLVYLHVKGADIAGHDRQPERKKEFIEKTDHMLGKILQEVADFPNLYFALGADHSTPSLLGEHSGDPVPVCLSGHDVRVDSVCDYGERSCARGGLGRIRCKDFLATIFDYLRG